MLLRASFIMRKDIETLKLFKHNEYVTEIYILRALDNFERIIFTHVKRITCFEIYRFNIITTSALFISIILYLQKNLISYQINININYFFYLSKPYYKTRSLY